MRVKCMYVRKAFKKQHEIFGVQKKEKKRKEENALRKRERKREIESVHSLCEKISALMIDWLCVYVIASDQCVLKMRLVCEKPYSHSFTPSQSYI